MNPYATAGYVKTCAHLGTPRHLPAAGGWLLERLVPDGSAVDAVAPYPLFACRSWTALADDLAAADDLVTVVAVVDPFADARPRDLERAFPDLLRPYKPHHIRTVDTSDPLAGVDARHLTKARRAGSTLDVWVHRPPVGQSIADRWVELYTHLGERHRLSAPSRFGPAALRAQLDLPEALVVGADLAGHTVCVSTWYVAGEDAYYHLGASSPEGYRRAASFAVFAAAIEELARLGVRRIDFGGGADGAASGLERFKRGWATHTQQVLVGGRVNDHDAYRRLAPAGPAASDWFPAYRG